MTDLMTAVWTEALELFTERNVARAMDLEIIANDLGAQSEEKGMVLKGVSYDYHDDGVQIMLGGKTNHHITHSINKVRSVDMFTGESSLQDVLRVSYDGGAAILKASPRSDVCCTTNAANVNRDQK